MNPQRIISACLAKTRSKRKAAEDLVIALLLHERKWTSDLAEYVAKQVKLGNRDFLVRLGRTLADGKKPPPFSRLEIFILENWDEFRVGADREAGRSDALPGFRLFADEAVVDLLNGVLADELSGFRDGILSLDSYRKLRRRIALVPQKPSKISKRFVRELLAEAFGSSEFL
jgi:hypothetical protein